MGVSGFERMVGKDLWRSVDVFDSISLDVSGVAMSSGWSGCVQIFGMDVSGWLEWI